VQHVEQLPFVFVNALDLDVEQAVRIEGDADLAGDVIGQPHLVAALGAAKAVRKAASSACCADRSDDPG
jgi:hypothetical protein